MKSQKSLNQSVEIKGSPVKEENTLRLRAHVREYARKNGDETLDSVDTNEAKTILKKGSRCFD